MRWTTAILVCALIGQAGCSPWSTESKLKEGGPTPYVRCLAAPPPAARSGRFGELGFKLKDRVLTFTPKHWPLRMAAFSAAGFGGPPRPSELARLRQIQADVLLMLGGLGDSDAAAQSTAKSLAGLGRPVLLVRGGRDGWDISQSALDGLGADSWLIDATALRRIGIANNTLIPVAGAEQGRYALHDGACGFGPKDLEALAKELGPQRAAERRWLISWQTPAGCGALPSAARSDTGVELGSESLGRFTQRIGALGALCAWPSGQPELLPDGPLTTRVVPRVLGPRLERPDGSLAERGVLLLELDDQGMRVVH